MGISGNLDPNELDIPDRLKEHGPQSAQELTQNLGVDAKPEFLERLLRACSSIGLFSERTEGRFGITPLSEVLTSDSPVSLKNCRQSMTGDGRLLCVDAVLSPMGDTKGTPAKFLDVKMIVFGGGKERTKEQWRELYATAGFELISFTPLQDNFGTSIVEGKKARISGVVS
jgi:hypothetical protein